MDKYQGKNLDRYQEEIQRAAAKGVKDLNLNGNITQNLSNHSGSHFGRTLPKTASSSSYNATNGTNPLRTQSPVVSSVSTTLHGSVSVSAAAAKFESLQRLNQMNISNGNGVKASLTTLSQNDDIQKEGRRRSTGPVLATMLPLTREVSGNNGSDKFISKSNSASSVLQHLTNGNQILRSISTIPTGSSGGVIADFAFGNGDSAQNNNINTATSNILNRDSPLTLNNEMAYIDQNPSPQVHQLAARFNQVLNTNTMSSNQCQTQNIVTTNNSNQSSRQSSVSPFPSRVSPSPSLKAASSGLTLAGITADQANMILTNQHNLSNGNMSIINHNIREQANTMVSKKKY